MTYKHTLCSLLGVLSLSVYGGEECDHDHDHDHEHEHVEAVVSVSPAVASNIGLEIREATRGVIEQLTSFPAEVTLNRDRVASVTPRFPSVIKTLEVEIGDEVKAGDRIATLENRETLATYALVSPLNGVVIAKHVSQGESAGEDVVIYEIADLSVVWIDVHIFPNFQHQVKKGQRVTLIAADGHTADTVIHYISPLMSRETRTIQARCLLENPDEDFLPGVFVRALIATETRDVSVSVEKDAVQQLDGEKVVFVETEGGFAPREVETGLAGGNHIEITQGLAIGERYVAKGAFNLKAEMVTSGLDPHAGHGH